MNSLNKRNFPLSTLYLYLTGSCNLNCRHCWIDPKFRESTKDIGYNEIESIVKEAIPLGLKGVKITGGEPLLHPDIIKIIYGLHSLNMRIGIETNGTLLSKEIVKAFKRTKTFVAVSMDGPSPEVNDYIRGVRGAFDKTLKGIRLLRREGVNFQIITCLYKGNRENLKEMIEFARDLGASSLKINPILPISRAERMDGELLTTLEIINLHREFEEEIMRMERPKVIFDIPIAFKSLKEIKRDGSGTCGILNILGVLHDGTAALCGIGEHIEEMKFGNILKIGIREIWEENETLNLLRDSLPRNLKGICGDCIFKNYCLGKCRAQVFYEKRDLLAPFSFCQEAYDLGLFPELRLWTNRERVELAIDEKGLFAG